MNLNNLYTPKQQEVLKQYLTTDFFIMINTGSVRSGKTEIDNDIFLMELRNIKKRAAKKGIDKPQYICAGTSIATFFRNVLMQINNKYDLDIKLDKYNSFELFGVRCTVFGHEKINDLRKITGMEAWGAYINEVINANEQVFDEIYKRCSGVDAKIICDTNPGSPEHYIKKNYIDKADGKRIISNTFLIDENTFLDPKYIANVKASTPSGVFYNRKIKSLWCMADGVIYEDFDEDIHYIKEEQLPEMKKYWAGVDWGYAVGHSGCIVIIGEGIDGNYYLVEEEAKEKKDITYWVDVAKNLEKKYSNIMFMNKTKKLDISKLDPEEIEDIELSCYLTWYCDSARPEHVDKFVASGLYALNADKAVESGIELVATLYKTKRLFVVKENCELFQEEIYRYVWGKDGKPKKMWDNNMDSKRYALFSELEGNKFILYNLEKT